MSYEYNHSPFPLTVAGTIVLSIIYSIWLIELIPFAFFDDAIMWFYGWFLNWLESGDRMGVMALAIDGAFVYLKYLFLPHLAAGWATSNP